MSGYRTFLYTDCQLLTRRAVFRQLCGGNIGGRYEAGAECPGVFLNFCDDLCSASDAFARLRAQGAHVIVYSDVPLSPFVAGYLMDYDRCSLIMCPQEYELERARVAFGSGRVYRTEACMARGAATVPLPGGAEHALTAMQLAALYCLACGMPQKAMAAEMGTSEKYVSKVVARLKELFGGCETTAQLLASASLVF